MSQHEDDGYLMCSKCGTSYDVHEALRPECDGEDMSDPKPLEKLVEPAPNVGADRHYGWTFDESQEMARRLRVLDKTVDFYRVEFRRQSKGTTLVPLEEIRAILDGRGK